MIVNIPQKLVVQADIRPEEAFLILCETLSMEFLLDWKRKCFVKEDETGRKLIYETINGEDKAIDGRVDLLNDLLSFAGKHLCITLNCFIMQDR